MPHPLPDPPLAPEPEQAAPRPIVVLVHHVHCEQWPVVMGPPSPCLGRHRMARAAAPLLGCVGRLVPHKRIEHALEVLARWPGLRLAIVGDGWAAGVRSFAIRCGQAVPTSARGRTSLRSSPTRT